jgi:hypothetical protein
VTRPLSSGEHRSLIPLTRKNVRLSEGKNFVRTKSFLYRDEDHLSVYGSAYVGADFGSGSRPRKLPNGRCPVQPEPQVPGDFGYEGHFSLKMLKSI